MENYRRSTTLLLNTRLNEPVRRLLVIAGPRQIGKTTAITQVLQSRHPNSCKFHAVDAPDIAASPDFSSPPNSSVSFRTLEQVVSRRDESWLIERWQAARQAAIAWHIRAIDSDSPTRTTPEGDASDPDKSSPYVLVFDEIQQIPNWSSVIKGLWDQDRLQGCPMHVVVLGSAPLLMQHGLSESLMGRFELLQMRHWSYSEMRDCFGFTLDQYIYFGGYPGPAPLAIQGQETRWREEVLHSLIEPNLVKDILALARIEKPALLRQLFELGCGYSGQIVALTKLMVQLQDAGNTTTLTHYLKLLGAAGLLEGIEKFAATSIRQRAAPPKLNVLNTAFVSVYSGRTFDQARSDHAFWGHLVESCVGAHLINTATEGLKVTYWRESPLEVDFVLKLGDRVTALEVKSTRFNTSATKGLIAFTEKHAQLKITAHVVGGDDLALAEALCKPAAEWLSES